jgi:REP element-mobilizing transposase RayT
MAGQVPEQPGRRSIGLKGYDYSQGGGYYVTIVTLWRECLFGVVVSGEMRVNALGRIVQEEWFRSARIRKEIHLIEDEFVFMPDHIHGILWIDTDTVGADGVRPVRNAGAHRPRKGKPCAPTPKTEIIGLVYCRIQGIRHHPRQRRIEYQQHLAAKLRVPPLRGATNISFEITS